ncbi:MAG: hypothetical protein QXF01_00120 [Candidatus Micrarchaeaceae archaeon]
MNDDSFIERILYKLVKRHVSGTTMSSALDKAKDLNSKNLHVSITFLSNSVATRQKAKYATTTYLELIRQISRLGLKASIQVPLSQLGLGMDENTMLENLGEIIKVGNKYGVFVWAEIPQGYSFDSTQFDSARGFGIATHAAGMLKTVTAHKHIKSLKIIFSKSDLEVAGADEFAKQLAGMNLSNTVMLSPPDSVIKKVLNGGRGKTAVIEFRFGENSKKIKSLAERGTRASVYLPFGKDWQAYAINNVPEGYMRFLAAKFLTEADEKNTM